MIQLFKSLTDKQYKEKDLHAAQLYEVSLLLERRRISGMIDANKTMIQQLENELEIMK